MILDKHLGGANILTQGRTCQAGEPLVLKNKLTVSGGACSLSRDTRVDSMECSTLRWGELS